MRARVTDTAEPNDADPDPLDRVGQTVVNLLQRAADIAEENYDTAVGDAQKVSLQLQAAEDQIKELEAGIEYYKDRADRAESWLRQISLELEQRFVALTDHIAHPDHPAQQAGPPSFGASPPSFGASPPSFGAKRDSSVVNQAMRSILELEKRFVAPPNRRSHQAPTSPIDYPQNYPQKRGSGGVDQLRRAERNHDRPRKGIS